MLSQPKLVKSESPVQKQLNAHKNKKSNARFLMGLNNRVAKLDKRMEKIESHIVYLLRQRIGYRELALTLVLALLIFTSITLAVREISTYDKDSSFNEKLIRYLNEQDKPENKQQLLDLISHVSDNPDLIKWAHKQTASKQTPLQNEFIWPLEKRENANEIQYSQYKHGIHIATKLGDPVIAIAAGKVLYSGSAISGYGNLILIQHKNNIISVYGNNYSNYIKEGQNVSQGELIAAAGEAEGHSAKLYFEIRYKGKAEDPFLYFNQAF